MADLSLNFSTAAMGTSSYGDIVISQGDLLLTADTVQGAANGGTDPVSQAVAQNCRVLLGEFFLDASLGVPYYQELFGQRTVSNAFETALQGVILNTPGVTSLLAWKLETQPEFRRLVLSFTAQTTVGQVIWSGNINPTVGGGV